ncbi:hypothetical protein FQR65_LT10100 [Abscondita terminalis]|nr:hypothetical protein FQR65_LT10100 [Abscondita terminalis]
MAKLAIWFLSAIAIQAAFAGVPRYMNRGSEMMTMDNSRDMFMFFENFCHGLEYKDVDKDMMMCCIQEFIMFMNMLCEKLECSSCTDQVFVDCMMVCKMIKTECEKMLKYVDVREMKMDFVKCVRMFCMDLKNWCMHEEFLARFMHKDILMHLRMMVSKCMGMKFSNFMNGLMMNMDFMNKRMMNKNKEMMSAHMMGQDMMGEHMMDRQMMGENMMDGQMMGDHMMREHMMGGHMMGEHMMDGHTMDKHMMGKHMMDGHMNSMMGKYMMDDHMMGEHMMDGHMMGEHMMGKHMMDGHMMGEHMMDGDMMGEHMMDGHMMEQHMMDGHTIGDHMMMGKHMMGEHMMDGHMMDKYFMREHMMAGHKTNRDLFMHFELLCKKFIAFCERTEMSHHMLMTCMQKFMMVIDYTMEKLCASDKCDDMMMREICMKLKNIKMMLEHCLSYGIFFDMYKMKMECCECVKMFFTCMEKWMMCNNCCVNFDMMCKDICMRFMGFYETVCGSTMYRSSYSMMKNFKMDVYMWYKKLMVFFKHTDMTKDKMMVWIPKFITVVDYTIEKLCFKGKCHNPMIQEICAELKNMKMVLERCLTYDFQQMKMECFKCCNMFFRCLEKLMMCDDCCVGFDIICKDICMYFVDFCKIVCERMDFAMVTDMYYKDMTFNQDFRMLVKKFIMVCESGKMTKEMMMMCMRKLMMIIDYAVEKLCFGDKCNDSMMSEVCIELKKCKMMLERCLSYGMFTNVEKMRMECSECFKMFFDCMERWMMCDNCCMGLEMMWKDVFMGFKSLCDVVFQKMNTYGMDYWHMTGDYTNMYPRMKTMKMMPYFMHRNM